MASIRRWGSSLSLASALGLLGGCGGGGGQAEAPVTVVAAPPAASASTAAAAPAPPPAPAPTPSPAPADAAALGDMEAEAAVGRRMRVPLPPIDLSDMRLWNWGAKWHASEWNNGMSPIPWRFDRVTQAANGDTHLRLDAAGAPQLQALNGIPAAVEGLWEVEATLPQLRDGLVVAPLWLYDPASGDEIDFEFAGRGGLDVSLHARVDGQHRRDTVRLFAGRDMSGERHRFGIRVDHRRGVVEMFLDAKLVHRWRKARMPFFVSQPLKPFIEMWAADPSNGGFVGWVGQWRGLSSGESLVMIAHGYGYLSGL